jgi:type II secretory pathway pseudopilin PulG
MPPATWREDSVRRARQLLRLLGNEHGISLAEVTIALVLLAVVGAAMVTLLTSATAATKLARHRTVAQQAALSQIEAIRAMDYNDVGIVAGNPAGCLGVTTPTTRCPNSSYPPATASISNGGLLATLSTQVSYVNDPGPLSYTSFANYKKIVVTVARNSDSSQLAREVTYVAPPVRASQSNAVINARVVDYGNSTQVANVPVALATGPDAPRNDVTDASGTVLFAGLTPNPTSGPTAYYDLSLTPPTGYVTLYDTVSPKSPAHVQLSPGQTWPTALYIYQPATIYLDLRNSDGTAFTPAGTTTATLKYTRNSTAYTKNVSYTGSPVTVTTMTEGSNTVQVIPGLPYTASALSGGFYEYDPATQTVETSKTENVPDAYPTTLTHTFTLTNAPTAALSVQVTRSGVACKGATVTVSAGPWGGAPWNFSVTGTTDASTGAAAVLNVPVLPSGTTYTIFGKSNKTSQSRTYTGQSVSAPSTTFNAPNGVALTSGSTTC